MQKNFIGENFELEEFLFLRFPTIKQLPIVMIRDSIMEFPCTKIIPTNGARCS